MWQCVSVNVAEGITKYSGEKIDVIKGRDDRETHKDLPQTTPESMIVQFAS